MKELERRIVAIEETIAAAATGSFASRLAIEEHDELSSIESCINVMLDALEALFRANAAQTEALQGSLARIAAQQAELVELSMPVIEVWDDVLVVPIIGSLDATRSEALLGRLLPAIVVRRARTVVLDLTGVADVDAETARRLTRVVDSARLLGAPCLLTGINPRLAVTLADLGRELDRIRTYPNLREGLKASMGGLGNV